MELSNGAWLTLFLLSRCPQDPSPGPVYRYCQPKLRLLCPSHHLSYQSAAQRLQLPNKPPLHHEPQNPPYSKPCAVPAQQPIPLPEAPWVTLRAPSCPHTDTSPEWIKALLAVPFVIHSQPTGVFDEEEANVGRMAAEAHRRYAEILKDVEGMVDDYGEPSKPPSLSPPLQPGPAC